MEGLFLSGGQACCKFLCSAKEQRVTAIQYKFRGYSIKPTTVTVQTDQGPIEKVAEWQLEKDKKVLDAVFQTSIQAEEWIMKNSSA